LHLSQHRSPMRANIDAVGVWGKREREQPAHVLEVGEVTSRSSLDSFARPAWHGFASPACSGFA